MENVNKIMFCIFYKIYFNIMRCIPVVIGLAVELGISCIACVCEGAAADTATEAVFVP